MGHTFDIGNLKEYYDKLTPEEKTIRLKAFYRILDGSKSNINDLSIETGLPEAQVDDMVKKLARNGAMVVDKEGFVIGSHGLSLVPTSHRLRINGQDLYTWCAADAIGIPSALEADAKIKSSCFQCNDRIEIEMVKGKIKYSNHEDARLFVVEADLGRSIVGCT